MILIYILISLIIAFVLQEIIYKMLFDKTGKKTKKKTKKKSSENGQDDGEEDDGDEDDGDDGGEEPPTTEPPKPKPKTEPPKTEPPKPPTPTEKSEWAKYAGCCVITNGKSSECHVNGRDTCPWTKGGRGSDIILENPKVCTTLGLGSVKDVKMQLSNLMAPSKLEALSPKKLRAAFLKSVIWPASKKVVTVGFIRDKNYSESKAKWVRDSVEKYIIYGGKDKDGKPARLIRLNFQWDYQPVFNADIRITFDRDAGAYSALGSGSLTFARNGPTMNLGWLDTSDESQGKRESKGKATVVIHEFGHALGMIHEHNREDASLPWNCRVVRDWLQGEPNSWCDDQIDSNVFSPVPMMQLNASEYDPKSIMHYYFPPEYFIPPIQLPFNSQLSYLDKIWLAQTYPTGEDISILVGNKSDEESTSSTKKSGIIILVVLGILIIVPIVLFFLKKNKQEQIEYYPSISSEPVIPSPSLESRAY